MSNQIISHLEPEDVVGAAQDVSCKPTHPADARPVLQPRLQDEEIERIASIFKASAHPVRIKILDLIDQGGGEVCSCEIEPFFDLSQPTISHHLKVLQEAGLITSEPRGVWVYHKIRPEAVELLRTHLAQFKI